MLPLKASVNSLQDALWNADGLVRSPAFLDWRLKHDYARLVLEKAPDGLDVEAPQFRDF
jgi:hypothetical protein